MTGLTAENTRVGTAHIRAMTCSPDTMWRNMVREMLEREPQILVFDLYGMGLAKGPLPSLPPDLLLVDGSSHDSVPEQLSPLKALAPAAVFLWFTASIDPAEMLRVLDAGAAAYLARDTAWAELRHALRAVLHGARVIALPASFDGDRRLSISW